MRSYALVLSNDLTDPEAMLSVIEQTRDYIDGVKIGITSSMVPGIDVFKIAKDTLKDKEVNAVLADYKVADIGFKNNDGEWEGTNEKIIRSLSEAGADYITCHTIIGLSSIEESVATAHKHGSKVLTLPYMTHKGANLFFGMPLNFEQGKHIIAELRKYGILEEDNENAKNNWLYTALDDVRTISDLIIVLGNHFKVDGFIGPGNDPEVLGRYRMLTNKEIWSPGFGRQDKKQRNLETQIRDWAKVVGPDSAMIVGSLIYGADNPGQAAKEVMEIRDKVVSEL